LGEVRRIRREKNGTFVRKHVMCYSTDFVVDSAREYPQGFLSSTHGNSADLDPLSSSLPSASPLDKDSGFNLIESGDSQGCGDIIQICLSL
jgi:hypothetical protein